MYELFNFKYFCVGNVRDDTSNEIEVSDLRWGRDPVVEGAKIMWPLGGGNDLFRCW